MQPSSAPFTYPPLPKGTKVVAVMLTGEEKGEKEMDLMVQFLSFFTIFGSTLWGSWWTKGFKAAAWH